MGDTSRIPKAEISGVYGAIVKRFSKKMLGDVAEPIGVYWHNAPVLKFYFASVRSRTSGRRAMRT